MDGFLSTLLVFLLYYAWLVPVSINMLSKYGEVTVLGRDVIMHFLQRIMHTQSWPLYST